MLQGDAEGRLDEIRRAEYSSRLETLLRVLLVGLGALAYFGLTRDPVVLLWFGVHLLFEVFARSLLTGRLLPQARQRLRAFLASYMLASLIFVALPLHIIAQAHSAAATTAAIATLAGHLVYALHRRQRERGILYADALTFGIEGLVLLAILESRSSGFAEVAIIAVALAGVTLYAIVALFIGSSRQTQLREAQQRYAEAQKARALNQFVGGVAHEFNNQLTAILGNLELFEELQDPKDRAEALRHSREAAGNAAATVRQLLASSGRQRLRPVCVEMAPFVQGLRHLLDDLLEPGITLRCEAAPGLRARADRDMLETCVVQLCLNAQDAMAGKGRITLRADLLSALPEDAPRPEAPPPWVALSVSDEGPGVAPGQLPRLTEPFFTSKPPNEGRGLGLSAVAGFARQSRGALHLDQPPGAGLRARLLLPLGEAPDQLPES